MSRILESPSPLPFVPSSPVPFPLLAYSLKTDCTSDILDKLHNPLQSNLQPLFPHSHPVPLKSVAPPSPSPPPPTARPRERPLLQRQRHLQNLLARSLLSSLWPSQFPRTFLP